MIWVHPYLLQTAGWALQETQKDNMQEQHLPSWRTHFTVYHHGHSQQVMFSLLEVPSSNRCTLIYPNRIFGYILSKKGRLSTICNKCGPFVRNTIVTNKQKGRRKELGEMACKLLFHLCSSLLQNMFSGVRYTPALGNPFGQSSLL